MKSIQSRLTALGFDAGPADGVAGRRTLAAINAALDRLAPAPSAEAPTKPAGVVPLAWMPWAKMQRIVVHWTAGAHIPNEVDRRAYHILIRGDGDLARGVHPITANAAPIGAAYAAHTRNLNGGSIGVSLCGMMGAHEVPFQPGPQPITEAQWRILPLVLRDLCQRYGIAVTPQTVLSHAEVQPTLGVAQTAKWDISVLPWSGVTGARRIGDLMRAAVSG